MFKDYWEILLAAELDLNYNKELKSADKLIQLNNMFKRKLFKKDMRETLEALLVSSVFNSSIFWNLCWIISLLHNWMRLYCL